LEIATALRVSVSDVSEFLSQPNVTGERAAAAQQRCHLAPRLAGLHDVIREQVAERSDATSAELPRWLLAKHQVAARKGLMQIASGGQAGPSRQRSSGR
jgi:hypothetical protein